MNLNLIRKLISKGIIRQNTEIEASYIGVDMAGRSLPKVTATFFIQGIRATKSGLIYFDTVSTVDGSKRTVESATVHSVDGMPLERLASIYSVNETGGDIEQGKRRGRRPRAQIHRSRNEVSGQFAEGGVGLS